MPEEGEERRSGRSHFWPNTNFIELSLTER